MTRNIFGTFPRCANTLSKSVARSEVTSLRSSLEIRDIAPPLSIQNSAVAIEGDRCLLVSCLPMFQFDCSGAQQKSRLSSQEAIRAHEHPHHGACQIHPAMPTAIRHSSRASQDGSVPETG